MARDLILKRSIIVFDKSFYASTSFLSNHAERAFLPIL
jgi:hypothetical protein